MCQSCLVIVIAVSVVCGVTCFNVDHSNYASYDGPSSSMFGFSIAVHKEDHKSAWLIVGAPEAQSAYQSGVYRGGAVYKCPIDRDGNCQEIPFDTKGDNFDQHNMQLDNKTEQWFGATVSSSGSENGPVVACAPRYTWYPRRKSRRDPVGTCYVSDGSFSRFNEYSPCRTFQWGYHRQGSCQAGFSAAINSIGDRLFMGAPGSWYWQGQMYSIDARATFEFKPLLFSATYGAEGQVHQQSLETRPAVFSTIEGTEKDDDSYMGYSTIVGDFQGNGQQGIAVGMPRGNNLKGKVLLFSWNLTNFLHLFSSDQLGSYYGYALAASDVDGDGKVDLIVGAPMYTITNNEGKYDVGRVYVIYHESDKGKFVATYVIDGFTSKSRFGQALASLGDINQDGYGDFAVGAPYDGANQRGAVYIYHGSSKGVRKKYSQVIYAEDIQFQGPLTTFGFSITGGLDLDGNEYPDMAVGAYLSDKAFFFRSRPVVKVKAEVRFLTRNKEVDIKVSNYNLRNGNKATLTEIDFCISYSGSGIPDYIDLNLQYILDSKKMSNPRMGFVDRENTNILNDTIRIYKDRAETCRRKEVYVLSDIRDKLTALVAEVKYWMQDDSISAYEQQRRDPRSVLRPILDLNQPPSRKDSISVHKECGDDNICIPNLVLTVTPSVDKYLLGSKEHLNLDVFVANTGEDSFESTLEVKYPENIFYVNIKDETVGAHVLCNTYENNTLKCEIGNPVPKDKTVKFKIFWQPIYKKNMPSTYDFSLIVNSTNQENRYTRNDNARNISVGIWSDSRLDIRGKSREVFFNTSLYTADISQQSTYTLTPDKLRENVIGPEVIHVYYLKNEGPAAIEETELFFAWPAYTLSGEDFLYLLEPPHFLPAGKVTCGAIPANYRGFNVEVSKKSIWDRLNLNVATESSAAVGATIGGSVVKGQESINKAVESSGDSSKVQQERHHQISSVTASKQTLNQGSNNYNIGSGGGSVSSNLTHYRNSSGYYSKITGHYLGGGYQQQGGYNQQQTGGYNQQDSNYHQQQASGQAGGYNQQQTGYNQQQTGGYNQQQGSSYNQQQSSSGQQQGGGYHKQQGGYHQQQSGSNKQQQGSGSIHQQSGGYNQQQSSGGHQGGGYNVQQQSSGGHQGGGYNVQQQAGGYNQQHTSSNVVYRCLKRVNGREEEVDCGTDFHFPPVNNTWLQQVGGYQQSGDTQYRCFEEMNGNWRPVVCGSNIVGSGRAAVTTGSSGSNIASRVNIIHRCREEVNGVWHDVPCGPDGQFTEFNSSAYRPLYGGTLRTENVGSRLIHECYQTVNGVERKVPCGNLSVATGTSQASHVQQASYGGQQTGYAGQHSYEGQHAGYAGQQATYEGQHASRGEQQSSYEGHRAGYDGQAGSYQDNRGQQTATQAGYDQRTAAHGQSSSSQAGYGAAQASYGAHQSTYDQRAYGQHAGRTDGYEGHAASQNRQQSAYEQSQRNYALQSGHHTNTQAFFEHQNSQNAHASAGFNQSGTEAQQNEDDFEDEDEFYDDEEEETGEKTITSYIGNENQASSERHGSARDPNTYGSQGGIGGAAQGGGIGGAAQGGGFRVTTLDLGDFGAGNANAGQQGQHKVYHEERHWSETHQIPQSPQNTIERDNVPTDRPVDQRFYGRKKRQILPTHPSLEKVMKEIDCKAVKCIYMRCVLGNLEDNEEISIALRGRINARVLRNITAPGPVTFSTVMAARINKLPYIGTPTDQPLVRKEIMSTVSTAEAEIKPDIVPLWVIVLSAIAGSIILLLLVLLLYKVGFFKRNRPSSAPERQPLNRNGYHHGDEAL